MPGQCERCGLPATKYVEALGLLVCKSCHQDIKLDLFPKQQDDSKIIIAVSKKYASVWAGFLKGYEKNMVILKDAIHTVSNTRNPQLNTNKIEEIQLKAKNYHIFEK